MAGGANSHLESNPIHTRDAQRAQTNLVCTRTQGPHRDRDRSVFEHLLWRYGSAVRNRFKGLDLIDRVPDELWMEVHDIVQEAGTKSTPKKEMQKSKMAVWGGLTNSCERKRSRKAKEKRKDISI